MTNRWNRFIYSLWAPIYDSTVDHFFKPGRKRASDVLDLKPGENVVIVGVGTGADLPLLPEGVKAIGIDISAEMLNKARQKLPYCRADIQIVQGDVQETCLPENLFDAAILNLILSVVPDGIACLRETLRVLKAGGRIIVFDKFQPEGEKPRPGRKLINFFSTILGTDITRQIGGMIQGLPCIVISDEPSLAGGVYRVIEIHRT